MNGKEIFRDLNNVIASHCGDGLPDEKSCQELMYVITNFAAAQLYLIDEVMDLEDEDRQHNYKAFCNNVKTIWDKLRKDRVFQMAQLFTLMTNNKDLN